MFENLTHRRRSLTLKRALSSLSLAAGLHVAVVAGVLYYGSELVASEAGHADEKLLVPISLPPPPPPPPLRKTPKTVKKKKIDVEKKVTRKKFADLNKLLQPTIVPKEELGQPSQAEDLFDPEAEEEEDDGAVSAEEGGVEGGVKGGVKGGVLDGGVLGGVLGGVKGGVLGGDLGGDLGGSGVATAGALGVTYPKLATSSQPEYPERARKMGIEGRVTLMLIIATNGRVESVKVLEGHPLLRDTAERWARTLRFDPCMQQGEAIRCKYRFKFKFTLEG